MVYCGQYLCFTGRDFQDWNRRLKRAVPDEDEWPYPTRNREAVLERLEAAQVRAVTEFIGMSKR